MQREGKSDTKSDDSSDDERSDAELLEEEQVCLSAYPLDYG
jgi:hypothetical protein